MSEKNWRTYQLARQVRATHGRCLSDEAMQDPLLAANLALVNQLIEAFERSDLAERTALKLAVMMPRI